jgi:hypothetical protein
MTAAEAQAPILVLIPIFNDARAVALHLRALDRSLHAAGLVAEVLLVDDGSTIAPVVEPIDASSLLALTRIQVLELRRNLGHQRAIAVGLSHVERQRPGRLVIVMDGDGEDDPLDVPRLVAASRADGGRAIVFAERAKRSESLRFRVFYALYKLLHRILTGEKVRVGNFSAIPPRRLESLVVVSELWNHYAAAAFKSRQPTLFVPTRRARRLDGRSSMNFISLVVHGLSAISVYSEVVGVRLLVISLVMIGLIVAGLVTTIGVRVATDLAIPGWATSAAGLLMVLLLQAVMLMFVLSFVVLGGRQGPSFLPRRDARYYVRDLHTMASIDPTSGPGPDQAGLPKT